MKIDDVHADTVTEDGHKYMSSTGSWFKRWGNLENLFTSCCPTTGRWNMTWVMCDEEVDFPCPLAALVTSRSSIDEDLAPSLDLVFLKV